MNLELDGKRVLITGAGSGIGLATARTFLTEGANLVLVSHTSQKIEELEALAEVTGSSPEISWLNLDLTHQSSLENLRGELSKADILVNNAGKASPGTLLERNAEELEDEWLLKPIAYARLSRLAYAAMSARGAGVIVNVIGSSSGKPSASRISSSIANTALVGMTEAMGGDSLNHGVRVVGVNPGRIRTPRMEQRLRLRAEKEYGDADRWVELLHSQDPIGEPEDVANLIVFLASRRASFITGSVHNVHGGNPLKS